MDHLVTLAYKFDRLMNFQRTFLGFIITLTIALILLPIFLPPDPIWPSLLELTPLLLLVCAAFMFRRNLGVLYLLFVITFIGQCVRFDALRSNVLLPWRFSGLILDYVAWIEIVVCRPSLHLDCRASEGSLMTFCGALGSHYRPGLPTGPSHFVHFLSQHIG